MLILLTIPVFFTKILGEKTGITYELGRIHFTDREWQMKYNLNMTHYYETSKIMENCTDQISRICESIENRYCQHFFLRSTQFLETVKFDDRQLEVHGRSKRFFFVVFIPFLVGVTVMSLLASLATDKKALQIVKGELDANLDMLKEAISTTKNLMDTHEKMMHDLESGIKNINDLLNKLNDKVNRNQYLNNLLFTISFAMIDHNKNQKKLLDLFNGDAEKNVFNVVDCSQFVREIKSANKKLSSTNFTLAPITIDRVKFLTATIKQSDDMISILLRVPIVQKFENIIYEFTPIPFKYENQLHILDMEPTTYFTHNNGSKILFAASNMDCKTIRNYYCATTFLEIILMPYQSASDLWIPMNSRKHALINQ